MIKFIMGMITFPIKVILIAFGMLLFRNKY